MIKITNSESDVQCDFNIKGRNWMGFISGQGTQGQLCDSSDIEAKF